MPQFNSKGGVWVAKDKAAKEELKKRGVKTLGRKSETSYARGYKKGR